MEGPAPASEARDEGPAELYWRPVSPSSDGRPAGAGGGADGGRGCGSGSGSGCGGSGFGTAAPGIGGAGSFRRRSLSESHCTCPLLFSLAKSIHSSCRDSACEHASKGWRRDVVQGYWFPEIRVSSPEGRGEEGAIHHSAHTSSATISHCPSIKTPKFQFRLGISNHGCIPIGVLNSNQAIY